MSCKGIKHHEYPKYAVTPVLCLLQKPDKYFFRGSLVLPVEQRYWQEYSVPWFGHELWMLEKRFQISLEAKVTNCQYELSSSLSKLPSLWKLTRCSSPKFFQLFIQLVSWSAETDRNERKSKKWNPNIWLIAGFLACLLCEEKVPTHSKKTFGENGFWLQQIWNKSKH